VEILVDGFIWKCIRLLIVFTGSCGRLAISMYLYHSGYTAIEILNLSGR
jgi:hypothetical protein